MSRVPSHCRRRRLFAGVAAVTPASGARPAATALPLGGPLGSQEPVR